MFTAQDTRVGADINKLIPALYLHGHGRLRTGFKRSDGLESRLAGRVRRMVEMSSGRGWKWSIYGWIESISKRAWRKRKLLSW
jgi:hypothetical protein